jgi:uncharacterized membrane protein YGL010W
LGITRTPCSVASAPRSVDENLEENRMIRLNADWTDLMKSYEADHQDPRNQTCHKVGIPLIAASIPLGATIVGLPLAAAMFSTGWAFQFAGHLFEGKKPSFVEDRRMLFVGLLWWLKKSGARIELQGDGEDLSAGERHHSDVRETFQAAAE